eukprot:Sspe_Gene.118385::Locus_111706_Transcript_1_2_Confidence_0.667_Length_722::g.118385::m.118385
MGPIEVGDPRFDVVDCGAGVRVMVRRPYSGNPEDFDEEVDRCSMSLQLWDGGRRLVSMIAAGEVRGETILEIGGGVGAAGVAAAKRGMQVVCTDNNPVAVEVIQANALLNGVSGLSAAVLDWDSPETYPPGPFDVVMCADVLFVDAAAQKLFACAEALLRPGGSFIMVHEKRCAVLRTGEVEEDDSALRRFLDLLAPWSPTVSVIADPLVCVTAHRPAI